MPETLGFIGTGRLGLPIAANLMASGFALRVYNRTPEKARPLAEKGATLVSSPSETASRGAIVISIVMDDRALEAVAGDELSAVLGPGGVHISMSTVSPKTTRHLAERYATTGASFVAAPVFGRPEAAATRKLWICTSGPQSAKQRVKPIFDAIGQGVFDFGEDVGAANVIKLAGNFLLTAAIEAMAEASVLCEKNDIPRAALLNMLTSTLFNCPIYNNYSRRLIDADFDKAGFSVTGALKDMRLAQETAADGRSPMPILNLLVDRYLATVANKRENLDATAIAVEVARDAGITW